MNLSEQTNRMKQMMNIAEEFNSDKLYSRDVIVSRLKVKGTPKHIRDYVNNLPYIDCSDDNGNKHLCTKIPQFIYEYLYGRY